MFLKNQSKINLITFMLKNTISKVIMSLSFPGEIWVKSPTNAVMRSGDFYCTEA